MITVGFIERSRLHPRSLERADKPASAAQGRDVKNLIVVATPHKLEEIDSLLVDTGHSELDRELSGRRQG